MGHQLNVYAYLFRDRFCKHPANERQRYMQRRLSSARRIHKMIPGGSHVMAHSSIYIHISRYQIFRVKCATSDTSQKISWDLWLWKCILSVYIFFVCFITKSFLTYLFYLHLLYQPCVGPCQATRVQSHQRQSTSAVAIATCEVQVSVADYQTVPTVATGVSKPLCCRLTLTFYTDQWEPIVIYNSITLTGRYTTMQPTLLTSWLQLLSYKV